MRYVLIFIFLLILTVSLTYGAENKIYVLNLNYNQGKLSLVDVSVEIGYSPDRKIQPEEGYRCEVISFMGDVLYSFKFELPVKLATPPPLKNENVTSIVYLDNVNFTLLIPYYKNGRAINIYDQYNFLVLSVDVSNFAKPCGDNICETELNENYKTCPQDCPSGGADNYCDKVKDNICDPDCKENEDIDCMKVDYRLPYLLLSLGAVFLILLTLFLRKIKKI